MGGWISNTFWSIKDNLVQAVHALGKAQLMAVDFLVDKNGRKYATDQFALGVPMQEPRDSEGAECYGGAVSRW